MAEDKAENQKAKDTAPQSGTEAKPYPARNAENGEEQQNRLGYMVTEPTEEEIDEADVKPDESTKKS